MLMVFLGNYIFLYTVDETLYCLMFQIKMQISYLVHTTDRYLWNNLHKVRSNPNNLKISWSNFNIHKYLLNTFLIFYNLQAGINHDQLCIALEPEVASIYCQHLPTEKLQGASKGFRGTGQTYMVVDLGGNVYKI